jgi:hypothetical protein
MVVRMISGLGRHSTGERKVLRWQIMFKQFVCGIYTCKKNLTANSYDAYGFARMPLVNNNIYLDLAKRDFNRCQIQHQLEWHGLQK